MNWKPLGREVKILVTQFIDALDEIIIQRRNKDLSVEDQIEVNIIYSPKQRTLFDIINKNQHIQIPIISCYITNFARDPGRVFNKIAGSSYNMYPATSGSESLLQPLPINITMGVSIICRYQTDLDQILGQLAYFDPYIVISWMDPLLNFTEVRSTVYWDEQVKIQYPVETVASQPTRIIADTSFIIKGWLYKIPQPGVGKIYKITSTFTSVSELDLNYSLLTALRTLDNSDMFTISAIPQIERTFPSYTLTGVDTNFLMLGDMFSFNGHCVSGLFAIPLDSNMYPTLAWFDPLSSQPSLSSKYPGFSGIEITDYTIEGNNSLTFTLPSAIGYGYIDLLVYNEAGYSKLSEAIKPNYNPWPIAISGSEYFNRYQDPSILGIEVEPVALSSGVGVYDVGSTFIITSS
jgi:hypothetical protein